MYLRPDSQSVYDVAQVCLNGHVTNGFSRSSPEFNETFCSNCGERTITVCPACNHAIRGQIAGSMIVSFPAPSFCHNCGEAYPWTARSLTAARELAEELENLGTEEKQILSKSLDDLVRDTPKTSVALVRFKNIHEESGRSCSGTTKKYVEKNCHGIGEESTLPRCIRGLFLSPVAKLDRSIIDKERQRDGYYSQRSEGVERCQFIRG